MKILSGIWFCLCIMPGFFALSCEREPDFFRERISSKYMILKEIDKSSEIYLYHHSSIIVNENDSDSFVIYKDIGLSKNQKDELREVFNKFTDAKTNDASHLGVFKPCHSVKINNKNAGENINVSIDFDLDKIIIFKEDGTKINFHYSKDLIANLKLFFQKMECLEK